MTLDESIEEVRMLREYVGKVNHILHTMPEFRESEVRLRAATLSGFMNILSNDLYIMHREWSEEKEPKT